MRVSSKLHDVVQRRERGFDRRAVGLFPGRELERTAQRLQRLVHGESGSHRRHFEQDAAGFPEIDGLEVGAVAYRGDVVPLAQQLLAESKLLVRALDGEGDVVHRSEPVPRRWRGVRRQVAGCCERS